jgi:hypothetical protein
MKLTREQIENILEHYKGQPASKFAEALEVQDVRALCDAALQVEAMLEAIGRQADRLEAMYQQIGHPDYSLKEFYEGVKHVVFNLRAQSLNPKNEEGKK